tara:strand:- start:10 stop:2229 length:2220 start_codon:yes stop_codon:yes gene_type:complete
MTEEKKLECHTPPLVDSVMEKEEATEKYLREEWPVEEGEVFSDLGEVEEAAKTLENTTEGGEKEDISLCVRRAAGEPYQEFILSGQYEDKKQRKEQLRTTLQHIGFAVGDNSTKGLLCLGNTLNQNEERALLEGFKGKHFFYMAKMCQLEKAVKSDGFVFSNWENKNDTQPRLDDDTKVSGEEKRENPFTLFGETFHLKCTNAVKVAIYESIAFLQCEEETFEGLSVCNWSSAHNHARYRVAKHLLDCNQREAFTSFCLRQFPKKRQRDKGEEKYEKKRKRTNPSRAAPRSIASVSTETHGAVEEKVGEREDIPEWLRKEFEDLCVKTEVSASRDFVNFFFRVFKFFLRMPALETDKESLKEVVAQMYDEHGEDAMFSVFDWHCNSPQKLEIYHSRRKKETYGVDSHERLIYYEKIPPWKTFPKLKRYEEITFNIVIRNVDGIADDIVLHGKRINERYSCALWKLREEKPAPEVQETPKAHHCEPPSGAPPPVQDQVEEKEPEKENDFDPEDLQDEDVTEVSFEIEDKGRGRRLSWRARRSEQGVITHQAPLVFGEYKKAVEQRADAVKVNKKVWVQVILCSFLIYGMDMLLKAFPQDTTSDLQLVVGFIVGLLILVHMLSFKPSYISTVVTIAYVNWEQTAQFAFVPAEIYGVVAIQMLCLERKYVMIVPVLGFFAYAYFTSQSWRILVKYSLTMITFFKGHRCGDNLQKILTGPYRHPILLVVAVLYTIAACFGFVF